MSKLLMMGKNALKSRVPRLSPIQILPFSRFSTQGEEPQQQDSSVDPFIKPPQGLVYGRVGITAKNMLKTDLIHYFDECNLSKDDIKVEYNASYVPLSMMLQFASKSEFDKAVRLAIRKGRLYKLDKVDRSQWDLLPSFDGKSVSVLGIPRAALHEDVERFLSGTDFDPNFQILQRPAPNFRSAIIKFPTYNEAMNAVRVKHMGFCLNNQIALRVLQ